MEIERLKQMEVPLLNWFYQNARVLPWRVPSWLDGVKRLPRTRHAYQVWISEIMLQQTRVEAVKPYFIRFIGQLPDVKALAEVPEDQLLKLWEGLGYYSRVRNMQKAAILIMEEYHGEMPGDYRHLLKLPGIGSYTAGAIASIVFGQAVPAVDGNVLRVISRICNNTDEINRQSVKKNFEEILAVVIPQNAPGDYNQALMELGATICVPNGKPFCEKCPLADICYARENACQLELPVKTPKKTRRIEPKTVFVIRDSRHSAIRRRSDSGLLAGLYELPNREGILSAQDAAEEVRKMGFDPIHITALGNAKHIFSHVEWQMTGYLIQVEDILRSPMEGLLFVEPEKTEREYPIPAAFSAYTRYLNIRLGQDKYRRNEI